jgi:predicted nucleic acid-binding protein
MTPIDWFVLRRASTLKPAALRTLDAIHLATAETLGASVGIFVTYDARLAEGARALGMRVAAPA